MFRSASQAGRISINIKQLQIKFLIKDQFGVESFAIFFSKIIGRRGIVLYNSIVEGVLPSQFSSFHSTFLDEMHNMY